MGNDRLRSAVARKMRSTRDLSEAIGVDPKTIERWLSGRTPHLRHREALARHLEVRSDYLWPTAAAAKGAGDAATADAEVIAIYPHRASVPVDLWRDLAASASERVDVLAYAALFLPEQDPGLVPSLVRKATDGCQVRILLGDADSPAVRLRGKEEGIGEGMAARVRMALGHYQPLLVEYDNAVRLHATTLYNSIFRFDDDMLVNTHAWGSNAYKSPVLHLHQVSGGSIFDTYATSFDSVWRTATIYEG